MTREETKQFLHSDKKEIDWDEVKELCKLHCTNEEIAATLEISEDTLMRRVKEDFGLMHNPGLLLKSWRLASNESLRRAQWDKAMKGDTTMQIWLGKQYLGQTDKVEENTYITPVFEGEDELED